MNTCGSLSEAHGVAAVALFEQGWGYIAAARHLGLGKWALRDLHRRWILRGRSALVAKPTKTSYTFEFKLGVVRRVLDEGATYEALAGEYGLSSGGLVGSWVRTYRRLGEDGLKPKPTGRRPLAESDAAPVEVSAQARLEQENLRLRAENAYLKKLRALRAHERR